MASRILNYKQLFHFNTFPFLFCIPNAEPWNTESETGQKQTLLSFIVPPEGNAESKKPGGFLIC